MSISVITPTIRKDGLDLVEKSLKRQSFKNWDWLICSSFDPGRGRWIKDDFQGGFWTLNRAYNRLFNEAKGELLISWQDWIYADPTALQKFWDCYEMYPHALVSGVGDQYDTLVNGKPTNKVWHDPRKKPDQSFAPCKWNEVEFNFCSIPKLAIEESGGADEQLDFLGLGGGGELYQMADRLNDLKWDFFIDYENESYTLRHGRERANWDSDNILFNGKYNERRTELVNTGHWPKL